MLYEDLEKEKVKIDQQRLQREGGTWATIRFRNKKDLDDFADILDLPHLKGMKYGSRIKATWESDESKRNALGDFFE